MAFTPRLTKPPRNSKYWINVSAGGYNRCIVRGSGDYAGVKGSVLHNCTGYAWGRFLEIGQMKGCNLPTCNAGLWYNRVGTAYAKGRTPRVGAVACYSKAGAAGHVAIVEAVNSDGSITLSQSGWSSNKFNVRTNVKPPGYYPYGGPSYKIQGFIYHPNIVGSPIAGSGSDSDNQFVGSGSSIGYVESRDFVQEFVSTAFEAKNQKVDFVNKELGIKLKAGWSAAFVAAVAKKVGRVLGVIIPETVVAGQMFREGVRRQMGKVYKGLARDKGSSFTPKKGDLVGFRWTKNSRLDEFYLDKVGIVYEVSSDGKTIQALEGDCDGGVVGLVGYSSSYEGIWLYFRPNWEGLQESYDKVVDGYSYSTLYTSESKKTDSMIRQIGQMNKVDWEPTTTNEGIPLSLINYTPALGALQAVIGGIAASKSYSYANMNLDGVNPVARIIAEFFASKGFSTATICGILAYCEAESGFRTDAASSLSSAKGLFQMIDSLHHMTRAVPDWRTNATGQCAFVWNDINSNSFYKSMAKNRFNHPAGFVSLLQSVPNTRQGAQLAARYWTICFGYSKNDTDPKYIANYRKKLRLAGEYFDKIGVTGNFSVLGGSSSVTTTPSPAGKGGYVWPLPGYTRISSSFGYRICKYHGKELHGGLDIPAPTGTAILAAKAGNVVLSQYGNSYGNYVRLSHSDGSMTMYCHMSQRLVSVGAKVSQGQQIGKVGSTGNSTGPHLHFEIWTNSSSNSRVNPMNYF